MGTDCLPEIFNARILVSVLLLQLIDLYWENKIVLLHYENYLRKGKTIQLHLTEGRVTEIAQSLK